MARWRSEQGMALVTTIVLTSVMLVMGYALLSLVDTQSAQTAQERKGDTAFNLAEATLEAQAFLLGRTWPQTPTAGTCGSVGQQRSGTLAPLTGVPTPTPSQQVQSLLAQTYKGEGVAASSPWFVNVCEAGGRSSWDATLLNGAAYDVPGADPVLNARRMWVRAEAKLGGHRRAVVGLVQVGKSPVLPQNLAVVTGRLKADLQTKVGSTVSNLTTGPLAQSVTSTILGPAHPQIQGAVGLRCSLLDADILSSGLGCLDGVFQAFTGSLSSLGTLLQGTSYVHFKAPTALSDDQVAQLRQQAKATSTYYSPATVASGAACLPVGSAGKVIFIEEVGDGTGQCVLNTAANPSAKILIVGGGSVKVTGGGTFTGVIYARHQKIPAAGAADVRIEGGSKVNGGVFADDNADLGPANTRGQVQIVPPPLTIALPGVCTLLPALCSTLDAVIGLLGGVNAVLTGLLPQLDASLPAVTYNANVVNAVTAFGDSAVVPGTFRQVAPLH